MEIVLEALQQKKKILVLGNGFDLYHGAKTGYGDFVRFTIDAKSEENEIGKLCISNPIILYFQEVYKMNHKWIDCEYEIEVIVRAFSFMMDNNHPGAGGSLIINKREITPVLRRTLRLFNKYIDYGGNPSYIFVNKDYVIQGGILDTHSLLDDLRNDLQDVIKVLKYYLEKKAVPPLIRIRSPQVMNLGKIDYVITFNYTDLYRYYDVDTDHIFSPHGSLSIEDSMVLGMPDEDDISLDFIYFKKYFQRLQKHTGLLDTTQFKGEDPRTGVPIIPEAYFFGMSMGKTDGDYIKRIIALSNHVTIYYHNQSDFEGKVINLIDIYGREELENMVNTQTICFEELEAPIEHECVKRSL